MTHATTVAAFAAALTVCANTAQAAPPLYGTMGVERLSVGDAVDYDIAKLRLGAPYGRLGHSTGAVRLGVEADLGVGLGDETTTVSAFQIRSRLRWTAGAFAVASLPIKERWDLLARVGYVAAKVRADAGFGAAARTADGLAGGVALHYTPPGSTFGVRLDYTRQSLDGDGADTFGISVLRRF